MRDVGLTRLQEAIALQVSQGRTNDQIAADLKITHAQLKIQFKSIFAKTKTDTRERLAMWVSGL